MSVDQDHQDCICEGEQELACSSEERETSNENGNTLPLQPSCGKLQKGVQRIDLY
jgi:hypothetical protein